MTLKLLVKDRKVIKDLGRRLPGFVLISNALQLAQGGRVGRVVSLPEKRAGGCRGAALRAMDVGEGLDDPEFLEIRPLENLEDFSFADLVREDYYSPCTSSGSRQRVFRSFD